MKTISLLTDNMMINLTTSIGHRAHFKYNNVDK